MLVLTAEDIKKVFTMKEALEADKKAFSLLSQGKSVVPLRTNIDIPKSQGQALFMPAYVEDINSIGIKIVSVFPKNAERGKPSIPAKMVLVDGETGEVVCLMDGTYLTRLRTGAAAGIATEYLAKKDAKSGAIFGTGGQAAMQLEAMVTVRSLEHVMVYDINTDRATEFSERLQEELKWSGTKIVPAKSAEDALSNADIITAVTTSKKPVFDGRLVKKGAHINGVGSYTHEMQELDEYIIKSADKVFVDSVDAAMSEAGDLIIPMEKGIITKDRINGEIGQVILGEVPGRTSDNEITVFKTVGVAVTDVVNGFSIYKKALELNIGQNVVI